MEENPLTSMDSLASTDSVPLTEGVFDHSVPSTEGNPLLASTENRMYSVSGSNKPSLSITDLPLTQEKVESTYADVFQGLGKFPGEPYKLRLKPDAVPAKHRPRKVPVHLQDAFHEGVE